MIIIVRYIYSRFLSLKFRDTKSFSGLTKSEKLMTLLSLLINDKTLLQYFIKYTYFQIKCSGQFNSEDSRLKLIFNFSFN